MRVWLERVLVSDCCSTSNSTESSNRCLRCGAVGRTAPRQTMESLLNPTARERIQPTTYYFDATPSCDVVYFSNEAGSYFEKHELSVRFGIKETEAPIPICYCFGHTAESAREELIETGRSRVADRITEEIQAGRCSCETSNPAGTCCLGEVNKSIKAIVEELKVAT